MEDEEPQIPETETVGAQRFRAAADTAADELREASQPETVGFQNSAGRIALELLVAVAIVVGLGVGATWGGGALAAALTPYLPTSIDGALGESASRQLGAEGECPNPAARRYVESLAEPLLEAAGELPFEFQFRVADDPAINAFALPGGFVTVNRGLLEAAETGEEVAGVLAHEIQHAVLRHGTRRVLRQLGGRALLWLLTGGSDIHVLAQSVSYLKELEYDRGQESEADREGLALLVRAGIDPQGLASFFERLKREGAIAAPELLSTHPEPGNRARLVREASAEVTITRRLPPPSAGVCR
jgi:beta-barrel assembly-enhancing protease